MYLYRAVDEHGQVLDALLRERRDLASARAFFVQEIARRGVRPAVVVTDKHPAYRRAIRRHARGARHVPTGLHRAREETTKPIECSHVPIKDRPRPKQGLQSIRTGRWVVETVEAMQTVHRHAHRGLSGAPGSAHLRARAAAGRVDQLAAALRSPTR